MGTVFRKIWNTFTSILVLLVAVLALLLVGVRVFGLQVFSVLTGSMEPAYPTGSVIYVKEVDPAELEPGDVITYMLSENTVATHRIVEVIPDEDGVLRFRTKGDANEVADTNPVLEANVLGTPVYSIPYLGRLASYIQTPSGTLRTVSVAAFIGLLVILPELLSKNKRNDSKH